MNRVLRPSDEAALVGRISAVSQGAGAVSTAWIPMGKFDKLMAVIGAGVLGAAATLDAKLEQATDSSGTGAKDITGKAITQLTKAGSDDNKEAIINLMAEEMDVTNGFDYARLTLTVGVAASLVSAHVLGFSPRYAPASDNDIASVDEIVG